MSDYNFENKNSISNELTKRNSTVCLYYYMNDCNVQNKNFISEELITEMINQHYYMNNCNA